MQTLFKDFSFHSIFKDNFFLYFIILNFILNLAYGYIPNIFPYFIARLQKSVSPVFLGFIKSSLSVGEIVGLFIAAKLSRHISNLFRTALIGDILSISFLLVFKNNICVIPILFFSYGLFDSLTQPFYGYAVSNMESAIRGKLLGVTDFIILLSAPLGMWIGGLFNALNISYVYIYLNLVLMAGFVFFNLCRKFRNIETR